MDGVVGSALCGWMGNHVLALPLLPWARMSQCCCRLPARLPCALLPADELLPHFVTVANGEVDLPTVQVTGGRQQ